eukprot:scaffold4690_cov116-Cylindrotheca_fusiformis.AAC.8
MWASLLQAITGFVSRSHHHCPPPTTGSASRIRNVVLWAMPELPSDVEKYTQLPSLESYFSNDFLPPGLLKDHSTKDGTWGVIRINKGKLQYTIGDESFELTPSYPGIIEPDVKHSVKPLSDDLEFVVEFYRAPV